MIPKLKFNEYIGYINQILIGEAPYSHIGEIEDIAKKLQDSHYTDAKVLLGTIASLRGDLKAVDVQFNAAIKNSGADPAVRSNYAKALENMHCHVKAAEVIASLVNDYSDDIEILRHAYRTYINAYNTVAASEIQSRLHKLGSNVEEPAPDEYFETIPKLLEFYEIDWKDVSDRVGLAAGYLNTMKLKSNRGAKSLSDEGIFYEFLYEAELKQLQDLEAGLQDYIASLPYSPVDNVISFGCRSV